MIGIKGARDRGDTDRQRKRERDSDSDRETESEREGEGERERERERERDFQLLIATRNLRAAKVRFCAGKLVRRVAYGGEKSTLRPCPLYT